MSISNSDWSHLKSNLPTNGAITGTGITSGVPNNVWPNVSESDRVAGGTDYTKTFFKNNNGTDDAVLPVVWFPVAPTGMDLQLGYGINAAADSDPAQGNMTDFSAPALVALISTAADTRVATIVGLDGSGLPQVENVTLTGTSEVLSVGTYSVVYAVFLASTNANTVTVKEGTGGTTRGTIGSGKIITFLWVTAGTSKVSGIALVNLTAGSNIGIWRKRSWIAGASPQQPDSLSVEVQENG